jgi:hypothetical protein
MQYDVIHTSKVSDLRKCGGKKKFSGNGVIWIENKIRAISFTIPG